METLNTTKPLASPWASAIYHTAAIISLAVDAMLQRCYSEAKGFDVMEIMSPTAHVHANWAYAGLPI